MTAEFKLLENLFRGAVDGNGSFCRPNHIYADTNPHEFANLDDKTSLDAQSFTETSVNENSGPSNNLVHNISLEKHQLMIPSTCLPRYHFLSQLELHLREWQAN